MMHILYLIDSLGLGGAETIVVNTLNYIVNTQKETEVSIITTVTANGYLKNKLSPSINYKYVDCRKNFLRGVLVIKKYSKENNITHIHSHLFYSIMVGRFVKMRNIKLFETYHNLEYNKDAVYYSWWRVLVDRITYNKKNFSIYVSDEVRQSIQRMRKKNNQFVLLNNFAGIDFINNYKYNNNNILKLIAVGNLKEDKNFKYALETFTQLKSYAISLDIYGDGELRPELQNLINTNNIKVTLVGRQQMDVNILSKYDAFLMTSLNEGMPISLLEAMNVGLPCILPDHLIVMKEVAQKGAIYFNLKDKNSLSSALKKIIKNKTILYEMSQKVVVQSKLYSIQAHITELMRLYSLTHGNSVL